MDVAGRPREGSSMARDVREVANAILEIAEAEGLAVTNLALNKIVYFAHAWRLAQEGRPLVDSPFEAWQYGPVHPQIYRQLKIWQDRPIRGRLTRIDMATGHDVPVEVELDADDADLIRRITVFYAPLPAGRLVEISHEPGAPWDQVWAAGEQQARPGMTIPDSVTETFYRSKLSRTS